jgi:hypothetical protein
VQKRDVAARRDRLEARPQLRVPPGAWEQPARQRAEVKAGSAGENRQTPAAVDVADRRGGVARVLRGGVVVCGIGDVDQVMRDAAPVGGRNLVGADVEAAVDRRGIAVDDLAVEPFGDRQRERALPRRGRAKNRDGDRFHPTRTTT